MYFVLEYLKGVPFKKLIEKVIPNSVMEEARIYFINNDKLLYKRLRLPIMYKKNNMILFSIPPFFFNFHFINLSYLWSILCQFQKFNDNFGSTRHCPNLGRI